MDHLSSSLIHSLMSMEQSRQCTGEDEHFQRYLILTQNISGTTLWRSLWVELVDNVNHFCVFFLKNGRTLLNFLYCWVPLCFAEQDNLPFWKILVWLKDTFPAWWKISDCTVVPWLCPLKSFSVPFSPPQPFPPSHPASSTASHGSSSWLVSDSRAQPWYPVFVAPTATLLITLMLLKIHTQGQTTCHLLERHTRGHGFSKLIFRLNRHRKCSHVLISDITYFYKHAVKP